MNDYSKIGIFVPTKDRPLFFDFLLATIRTNFVWPNYEIVSYQRVTRNNYKESYKNINEFYSVKAIEQKENEQKELKVILDFMIKKYDYIFLTTDDSVFYKFFDIQNVIEILENNTNILSYSFRLSKNLGDLFKKDINCFKNITDNLYTCNYKEIIKAYGKKNFDGESPIGHFTYPFELSASLFSKENLKNIIDNIPQANTIHTIEYFGRNYVIDNIDKEILMSENAQMLSIQWNGMVNDIKIITDNEIEEITNLKPLPGKYNFGFFVEQNLIEKQKDCFLNIENKHIFLDDFKNCLINRK